MSDRLTNELTLENIRSGAFPSDAHAVGFLLGEIEVLRGNLSLAEEGLASYALEEKQLRADISQAYDLRDKAEGRYCTALGEIERLTSVVTNLQNECERLMTELDQRPTAHEPCEQLPDHRLVVNPTMGKILQERGEDMSQYLINEKPPSEQRPADGTRDGDGVWQGGFWHPELPDPLDEWLQMEFAPKDGTRILALVTEVQFYRDTATPNELIPVVVKWTGEYSGWSMPGHGGLRPTLWLPIKLTNDPQGASRDASSDDFPECKNEPRDCPYIYCHSQLKCAKAPATRTSPADLVGALQDVVHTDPGPVRAGKAHRDASGHHCLDCGADLSNHPTAASAHRCSPQRTSEQRHD